MLTEDFILSQIAYKEKGKESKPPHFTILLIFKVEEANKFTLQKQFQLSNHEKYGSKCFGADNNCYVVSKLHPTTITFFTYEKGKYTLNEYELTTDTLTTKQPFSMDVYSEGKKYLLMDIQLSMSICPVELTN